MKSTATSAEVRQYLVNDNDWTHDEVDDLFDSIGTRERTHADWELAIADWQRTHPA